MRSSTTTNHHEPSSGRSTPTASTTQRILSVASRRRRNNNNNNTRSSSVSPPRDRNSISSTTAGAAAQRVRSSHPNAAFVTPSAPQRASVREFLMGSDITLSSFSAPTLDGAADSNNSNHITNSNTNNRIINRNIVLSSINGGINNNNSNININNNSGNNWRGLGNVGTALTRSPRRSATTINSSEQQMPDNDQVANNGLSANSAPLTPTSPRRRLIKNFRQGSIGSLFLGQDNNNNNNGNTSSNNDSDALDNNHNDKSNNNSRRKNSSNNKAKAQKVRKHHILQMTRRLQQQNSKRYPHADILAILEFWRTVCPSEVTLKMLAFLGPQTILQLQRTQRNIHHLLRREVSWRVLCEELYKWRPGDVEPESWKEHYRVNPCIPVDFSTIGLAMAVVGTGWTSKQYRRYLKSGSSSTQCPEMQSNVTIWLRPDVTHNVQHSITISTLRRSTQVTIRTMHTTEFPPGADSAAFSLEEQQKNTTGQPEECHPLSGSEVNFESENDREDSSCSEDSVEAAGPFEKRTAPRRTRALLQSKTRRRNEPLIRVLRGQLILQEVEVEHSCLGIDIWNGNAAIQVQPSYLHGSGSILALIPSASAFIQQSSVQSLSGRGIVTVDGGQLSCEGSYVHNCAATGVYIGGRGSCATLTNCDIWYNGTGNPHLTGGIARGHSGVYVEQSKRVELNHCTVAYNTASGISMIGNPLLLQNPNMDALGIDNNFSSIIGLFMTNSQVLSNGCSPIDLPHTAFAGGEMPVPQQFPWQLPDHRNRIAVAGVPQAKSIPLLEELKRQKNESKQVKNKKNVRAIAHHHQQQQQSFPSPLRRNSSWSGGAPWNA